MAVGPLVPASVKTVPDFLAWAKANPDKASFGSAGAGSAANFIGSALGKAARWSCATSLPRFAPAILEMMGGQLAAVVVRPASSWGR